MTDSGRQRGVTGTAAEPVFHENDEKPPCQPYSIEHRMGITKTLKNDNITKAVANHDKSIIAVVAPTLSNAYENLEGTEQKAAYRPYPNPERYIYKCNMGWGWGGDRMETR